MATTIKDEANMATTPPYNPIVTHPMYASLYTQAQSQVGQFEDLNVIPHRGTSSSVNVVYITLPWAIPRMDSHPYVDNEIMGLAMARYIRARLVHDMPQYIFGEVITPNVSTWRFYIYHQD